MLISDIGLFEKLGKIRDLSHRIFNLSLAVNNNTATCSSQNLAVAVVFITQADDVTSQELQVIQTIIENLPASWLEATDDLSELKIDSNIFILQDKTGVLIRSDDNNQPILNLEEIGLRFYETEADMYDFLIILNDFLASPRATEQASFTLVRNEFSGTNRIGLDRNRFHGSRGRLKGIINMNKIDQYSVSQAAGRASLLNLIHHEILHLWSASVSFIDPSTGSGQAPSIPSSRDSGQAGQAPSIGSARSGQAGQTRSWSLLSDDKLHWSRWVNWISPLGGWGWSKIKDLPDSQGLYASQRALLIDGQIIKLPVLDLYLMGLIPARYMHAIEYLVPEDPSSVSDEVVGQLKSITIDDIISAHGPWFCRIKK